MRPSVFLVRPLTAEVKKWLDANVDYQLMINEGIPIDYRHVDGILAGLKEAGFEIIMGRRASGGVSTLVRSTGWGEVVDPGVDLLAIKKRTH